VPDVLLDHGFAVEVVQVGQFARCDLGHVRQRGPDEVRDAGGAAGVGQVAALLDFVRERGFFPVVCYAEDGGGVGQGGEEGGGGVEIGLG
tara:strand:- start:1839 stop:2108 length:270 start_codon:yes stop_codon:yes gene_type:complete